MTQPPGDHDGTLTFIGEERLLNNNTSEVRSMRKAFFGGSCKMYRILNRIS
jgi:hypothetical protein